MQLWKYGNKDDIGKGAFSQEFDSKLVRSGRSSWRKPDSDSVSPGCSRWRGFCDPIEYAVYIQSASTGVGFAGRHSNNLPTLHEFFFRWLRRVEAVPETTRRIHKTPLVRALHFEHVAGVEHVAAASGFDLNGHIETFRSPIRCPNREGQLVSSADPRL